MEVIILSKLKHYLNKQAFSFLELLISLLITSLIIHSLTFIYQSFHRTEDYIRSDKHADFLHFMTVFEAELNHYNILDILEKEIIVEDKLSKSSRYRFELSNNKIYKSPGHQILLYEVVDWKLSDIDSILAISMFFENSQEFTGYIPIGAINESREVRHDFAYDISIHND